MGSFSYLTNFWTNVLKDKSMLEGVKPLLSIQDPEERAVKVIIHTLFVLFMDIKYERDEAVKRSINKKIEAVDHREPAEEIGEKNDSEIKQLEGNFVNFMKYRDQTHVDGDDKVHDNSEESAIKNCYQISDPALRLSGSSKEAVKLCKHENEQSTNISKLSPKKLSLKKTNVIEHKIPLNILAPETLPLDELMLHGNIDRKIAHAGEIISVPETIPIDTVMLGNEYGNTDFYETAPEYEIPVEDDEDISCIELRSPKNDENIITSGDSESEGSPILGKQHNNTQESSVRLKPKILDFELTQKEPMQTLNLNNTDQKSTEPREVASLNISTSDLFAENMLPKISSTPKSVLLDISHSNSASVGDLNVTSPSLLRPFDVPLKRNNSKENSPDSKTKLSQKQRYGTNVEVKGKLLTKSRSAMDVVSPRRTLRERSNKSGSRHCKGKLYEVHIEPVDFAKEKKYKQARISEMPLVPKTNATKLTDEESCMTYVDEVKAAVEASIKTKAMEDKMRENLNPRILKASPHQNVVIKDEKFNSESKEKCKTHEKRSVQISVEKTSQDATDKETCPSLPEEGKAKKRKLEKNHSCSPTKLSCSPRKHFSSNANITTPTKKKRRDDSFSDKEKTLKLDDVIAEINESPVRSQQNELSKSVTQPMRLKKHKTLPIKSNAFKKDVKNSCKSANFDAVLHQKNEFPKRALKEGPSTAFEDSFDIVPARDKEPSYAYCHDVVRKKATRRQLEGWSCHECKKWYEGLTFDPEEKKRLMNKCSKHRSKHNPVSNTPKNFWNPEWIDTPDASKN
ncbi:hypothetical protein SK128_003695 [Halocaridina rubra]|uniref:DNA endonuclease RBBP8 n=1 Tax=Halocaridina rubra TaxID=373956 RepID=A0AAN8WEC2_HALRR